MLKGVNPCQNIPALYAVNAKVPMSFTKTLLDIKVFHPAARIVVRSDQRQKEKVNIPALYAVSAKVPMSFTKTLLDGTVVSLAARIAAKNAKRRGIVPNGKCYRPYRLPGSYCCYMCRDLKDAEEFYKDSTRWNGCGSRCKKCDNYRSDARRDPRSQSFVGSAEALDAPRTKADTEYSRRQIRKRVDEIKSTLPIAEKEKGKEVHYKYLRDEFGVPYQCEVTKYENGKWVSTELKRV